MILDILVVMIYVSELSSMLYQNKLGTICMILEIDHFLQWNHLSVSFIDWSKIFLEVRYIKNENSS